MLEETLVKWKDMIEKEARQKARQEALLEGRRDTLLKLMTFRFGRLPKEIRSRVQEMTSAKELDRLTRTVLSAKSLQEMGLG